ncbi:Uncharacterised protein [Klebsiella pneumoniae]|uniref:Uncharacterized protein n=2 Tax=Klebsiella pneumoniae TaxID=573 RepID=A0A332KQB1_KLEPN|nr:Uncharacterised protein [Klebsiella pneumoniae]
MPKMSKAKHAFIQRFYRFDEDIQLVDYLSWQSNSRGGVLNSPNSLLPGDLSRYERLQKRNQKGKAFGENRTAVFTHLKQTIFSSYIKDSYEEVTEYFKVILKNVALSKKVSIKQLVGSQAALNLTALDIYNMGSVDSISNAMIDKIFKAVCGKLSVKGDDVLIGKAVCYLNIRHFLVHGDGKLPADFVEELKAEKIDFSCDRRGYIKEGANKFLI